MRREPSAQRRDYMHYEPAGNDKQAGYQRVRGVEDSSRLERVNSRQNNRDHPALKNELYEDVLYRMP